MLSELTDQQIWGNIKNNDSEADFNELYNRYWEKLYLNAFHRLRDNDAAANIVQDIFVTLWRRRKFLSIDCMQTYLGCAVRYGVFREFKKGKLKKAVLYEDISVLQKADVHDNGYELIYKNLELKVYNELNKLPQRCKEIFLLSRMEQLSSTEIAEHFNISKRTVDNQITLALKHLRLSLKDIIAGFIIFFLLFY